MDTDKKGNIIKAIEKITPLIIAIYTFLVYFGVFAVSKIFGESSSYVTIFKALVFVLFAAFLIFAFFIKKISLNKYIVYFLAICTISTFFSVIFTAQSKNVLSVGRAWMNIENYYVGYQYKVSIVKVTISILDKLSSLLDFALYLSCVLIYAVILPKLLSNKSTLSKTLFYLSLVVGLTTIASFIFDSQSILTTITNPTGQDSLQNGVKGIFTNKNTFGMILLSGFIAANMSIKLNETRIITKFISIINQIIIAVFAILSLCKTAMLLIGIYLLFSFVYRIIHTNRIGKKHKKIFYGLMSFVFAITIVFIFVPSFARLFGEKISSIQEKMYFFFVSYGKETIGSRKEAWLAVFQTVDGESIFYGLGDKIFELFFAASTKAVRFWGILEFKSAHNSLLTIYMQGGLIRLISYIAFIIYLFKSSLALRKVNVRQSFYITLVLSIFTFYSMVESYLFGFHDTIAILINLVCITTPISLANYYALVPSTSEISFKNVSSKKTILINENKSTIKDLRINTIFCFLFVVLSLVPALLSGYQFYARNVLNGILYFAILIIFNFLSIKSYKNSTLYKKSKIISLLFILLCFFFSGVLVKIINSFSINSIYNGYIQIDNIEELEWNGIYNHYHTGYLPLIFVVLDSSILFVFFNYEISVLKNILLSMLKIIKVICLNIKKFFEKIYYKFKPFLVAIGNVIRKIFKAIKIAINYTLRVFKKMVMKLWAIIVLCAKKIYRLIKLVARAIHSFFKRIFNKISLMTKKSKEKSTGKQNNVAAELTIENEEEKLKQKENLVFKSIDEMKVLVLSHNALANENANAVVLSNMLAHFEDDKIAQIFIKNDIPTRFTKSRFYKITDTKRLKGFFSRKTKGDIIDATIKQVNNVSKTKKRGKLSSFLSTSATGELIREFVWKHGGFDYNHLYQWINDFNPDVIVFVPSRSIFLNDLTLRVAKEFNLPIMLFTTEDEYFHPTKRFNLFHNILLKRLKASYHRVCEYVSNMVLIQDRLTKKYFEEFHKPCETIMMSSNNEKSLMPYNEKLLLYAGNVDRGRISTLLEISRQLELIDKLLILTVIPGGATEKQLKPLKERFNVRVLEFMPYKDYIKVLKSAYLIFNVDSFEEKYNKITTETFTGKTADLLRMGRPLCVIAPKYLYTYEYFVKYSNCAMVVGNLKDLNKSLKKVIYNENYRSFISKNAYELSLKNHDLNKNAESFKNALYKAYTKRRK